MTTPAVKTVSPAPRWRLWLTRALAGFALGCGCTAAVQVCWDALLVAVHGSLDTALKDMRFGMTMEVGFAAFFASMPASFLGGLIAPLVLGVGTRRRLLVVLSSAAGAALATVAAVVLGGFAAWLSLQVAAVGLGAFADRLIWQVAPLWDAIIWVAIGLGVLAGVGGGWLGGWVMRRAEPGAAADQRPMGSSPL